jgi:hypothetical protein
VKNSIIKSKGFISQVAKNLNCENKTIYNYVNKYPDLQEVINDTREKMIDFAESKLLKKIKQGDTTAIIFFLKTQGKHRGYSEKIGLDTNINFSNTQIELTDEAFEKGQEFIKLLTNS